MNASTNVCCILLSALSKHKSESVNVWRVTTAPAKARLTQSSHWRHFHTTVSTKKVYGQRTPSLIENSGMQCLRCVVEHEHRKPFLHCIDSLVVWLRWAQICTLSWCPVRSGWKLLDRSHGSDLRSGCGHLQRKTATDHMSWLKTLSNREIT